MKKVIALAAAVCAGVAWAAEDAAAAFDRAAAEGAARIVLAELAAETLSGEGEEAPLKALMLADPGLHRAPEASAARLVEDYRADLATNYAVRARRVLARLAKPRAPEEAFAAEFASAAETLDPEALAASAAENFPARFAAARTNACAEQAKGLMATVRPTEAEVDALDGAELKRILTERLVANQKTPVFEENVPYVSERLAEPILADAEKQRRHQTEIVRRAHPDGWAPATVAENLRRHLAGRVADERAKAAEGTWTYGVFPSVATGVVAAAAAKCALAHVADAVARVPVVVDEELVIRALGESPEKAARNEEAAKTVRPQFEDELKANALADAVREAPEAEREAFRAFAAAHLGAEPVKKAVKERFECEFMPVIERVRAAYAREFRLVDDHGGAIAQELKRTLPLGRELPGAAELEQDLALRVASGWDAARGETLFPGVRPDERPIAVAELYEGLFPPVRERIREKAKAILDAVKLAGHSKGGGGVMGRFTCTVVLRRAKDEMTVGLRMEGAATEPVRIDADPEKFAASAAAAAARTRETLEKALKAKNLGGGMILTVEVEADDLVYYGAATALVRAVEETAEKLGLAVERGGGR